MALTREEVLHVAELARLSLKPAEVEIFTRQLNDILAYVEKLQELDTTGDLDLVTVFSANTNSAELESMVIRGVYFPI